MKDKNSIITVTVILILLTIVGVLLFALFDTAPGSITKKGAVPIPTAIQQNNGSALTESISPLQRTPLGQINSEQLESLPGFIEKTILPTGETEYFFISPIVNDPDVIITRKNQVIFERDRVPLVESSKEFAKLSDYEAKYGKPEQVIQGSKKYGWNMYTYIYASKGFALIGNPSSNWVYEYQTYYPMTIEEYISNYGSDLDPESLPEPHEDPSL